MLDINFGQLFSIASYSTLFGLGYFFIGSFIQSRKLNKEKSSILNWKKVYTLQDQMKVKLDDTKKEGVAMTYMEINPLKSTITSTTINKRIQSFPKQLLGSLQRDVVFAKQCGNNFEYQFNRDKIKVNIKQCNIFVGVLDKKVMPIVLQPSSVPSHYDIIYTLKTAIHLSLIGTLAYNLQAKQFELEPIFMFPKIPMADIIQFLNIYYDRKLSQLKVQKFWFGLCIVGLSLLMATNIKDDCKKIWNYIKSKFTHEKANKLQYVQTRSNDRLKCMCDKPMNIIGNCGHLSMCSQCYQKDKNCKICNKVITKETIIYI